MSTRVVVALVTLTAASWRMLKKSIFFGKIFIARL
jgi:hypothetical protein